MQSPVQKRVQKLREEIAYISDASQRFVRSTKKHAIGAAEQERRLQRLKEILDELRALTDWNET
jgi:hypothetical protein